MTAKTTAERQRDYRARKAAQHLSEVRGLFAPRAHHKPIRDAAKKVAALLVKPETTE